MSLDLSPIVDRLAALREANRERLLAAPLDSDIEAALIKLSGPDAPLEFQQIARSVGAGHYTWHQFFAAPGDVAGRVGHQLVHQVTREVAARMAGERSEDDRGGQATGSLLR